MKPINKILVPTDFSKGVTSAAAYAIALAKAADARLFLYNTEQTPESATAGFYTANRAFSHADYPFAFAREAQVAALMPYLIDQPVAYKVVLDDDRLESAIRRTIDRESIDLVIVAQGKDDPSHSPWGSAVANLGRSLTPLIIVPENITFGKVNRILLATDYSRIRHVDTFQILVTLANVLRARIDVLHITPETREHISGKSVVEDTIERLLSHAHHTYHHCKSNNLLASWQMYPDMYNKEVNMVAVMPNERNFWESTTAQDMLYETGRPIFVYHR